MKRLETGTINFEGIQREYEVCDRNISGPAPRWFVSYNDGVPFISDEVPERYREFMVLHELVEFELLGDKSDSCLQALKVELKSVPNDLIEDYVPFREIVFRELIYYFKKYAPDSPFIPKASQSLAHVGNLV